MRVAINGFGRIGRQFCRIAFDNPQIDIIAINDLGDVDNLTYLLKYDSAYGKWDKSVIVSQVLTNTSSSKKLTIKDHEITVFSEKDPANLPWKDLNIDVAIESTGRFIDRENASKHLQAGAKKVLITAPAKNPDAFLILGVNHEIYDPKKHHLISMGSCTTNCAAPVAKVLNDYFEIVKGQFSTVHGYTSTQGLVDGPSKKDFRRGRAAALNIVPSSTGAAEAVIKVLPQLENKLDGIAFRVPILTVSVLDFVAEINNKVTVDDVNRVFIKESQGRLKGILGATTESLVSTDYIGDTHSAVVDLPMTRVVGENLVRVVAWYDNEWGYSARLVDLVGIL